LRSIAASEVEGLVLGQVRRLLASPELVARTITPVRRENGAAEDRWLANYNAGYLHSALGYRAPNVVEAEHLGHATPLAAAC
jgi:hypothetical protein